LTKDWFIEISNQLCNPSYCLFHKVGDYVDINPKSSINEKHLDYFYIFGRILGKAIYDRHLIDIPFSTLFFQRLLNTSLNNWTLKDVERNDYDYAKSLRWILNSSINDADLDLTFSVTTSSISGEIHEVPLIKNGINKNVNDSNKKEYVKHLVQWYCEVNIRDQINALRKGFYELMPLNKINIFTINELDSLIGGVKEIDVELLQNVCVYKGGYEDEYVSSGGSGSGGSGSGGSGSGGSTKKETCTVSYFWNILKNMTLIEKRKVLRFITGTTRVPLDGFDPCLQICKATRENDEQHALPTAHTCFNQLVLPSYSTMELTKEKLLYALNESDNTFGMT